MKFRIINLSAVNRDRNRVLKLLVDLDEEGYDLISHAIWRTHWDEDGSFIFKKREEVMK